MPDLTLTLTDDEWTQLTDTAARRDQDLPTAALYAIRKEIWKPPRDRASVEYVNRQTDRLARQVRIAQYIAQHGPPNSKAEAERLADRLGVSVRTIYRDIDLAVAALHAEARLGEPADVMTGTQPPAIVLPAPAPKPRTGRPPRQPRYKKTG